MMESFKIFEPKIFEHVSKAIDCMEQDLGFWRLEKESWEKCENKSIDYAIMERSENMGAIKLDTKWTDLGDWKSIWEFKKSGSNNLVSFGSVTEINCEDALLHSQDSSQELVGIGLKNLVVVAMSDAI